MRLTVVTVCRNAAATIGETLSSFFAQTYVDKHLIVVDGASTDDTVSIARHYAGDQLSIGAGGGGFLMFLAPPERHAAIRAALGALRETPFGFTGHGSRIVFVHE